MLNLRCNNSERACLTWVDTVEKVPNCFVTEVGGSCREVRFARVNGHRQTSRSGPKSATNGLHAPQQNYSITSSARASNVCGTVSPIALAVFRLIASSNLVGS